MIWFVPSRSGDFRLEPIRKGKTSCRLHITDPTLWEQDRILDPFLTDAADEGWVKAGTDYKQEGATKIKIKAPVTQAGARLAAHLMAAKGDTWTAIRFEDGEVKMASEGTDPAKAIKDQEAKGKKAKAAVTIAKPKRGCPPPEPCNVRAAQVLRAFSTRSQWTDFQQTRSMHLIGNHTGKPYRVFHRTAAAARNLGHLLLDHAGREVCVWDNRVPAEEEMLGIKLAVEHREQWLTGGIDMVVA